MEIVTPQEIEDCRQHWINRSAYYDAKFGPKGLGPAEWAMRKAIRNRIVTLTLCLQFQQPHANANLQRDEVCPRCRRRRLLFSLSRGQKRWGCRQCAEEYEILVMPPGRLRRYDFDANGVLIQASVIYEDHH